jgi:hypothetical protein
VSDLFGIFLVGFLCVLAGCAVFSVFGALLLGWTWGILKQIGWTALVCFVSLLVCGVVNYCAGGKKS